MAGVVAEEAARQWECDRRPSGQTVTKVYSSEEHMAGGGPESSAGLMCEDC